MQYQTLTPYERAYLCLTILKVRASEKLSIAQRLRLQAKYSGEKELESFWAGVAMSEWKACGRRNNDIRRLEARRL